MLLPIGIEYYYERKPYATIGLIAANTLMFVLQFGMPERVLDELMCHPDTLKPWQWVTSVFLHAGPLHLGGNMLFLWVYGRYVEERLGPWRYLLAYLCLGIAASWTFVGANLGDPIPALGASGAISGLMGLVMVVAASAKVDTIFMWGHYLRRFEFPVGFLLAFWVVEQMLMGMLGAHGIAISAHLGGFAAGFGLGLLLRSEFLRGNPWHLERCKGDRYGVREHADAQLWGEVAQHYRDKRMVNDRPSATHIPDWLRSKPTVVDPYEEEQLRRWKGG
jgi:membrane associated rhomboid family serine protease